MQQFKSFADRVADIDIRRLALYHIGHENEQLPEEENETFFHQTLKKWMVLNLSDEFGQFSRKVIKIVTLPQLIHQKTFVLDLLLEKLSTATNLSLQPLLELLYVLARDLREGFYTDFQRVLDRLICLLNTQDAELLEWTLVCLAYLFKFLKSHLKKNMGVVFHAILPLLDEQRYDEHVTNFAVECFSFIARDVKDYGRFLNYILETVLMEQVEAVNGCGRLMFEMMRGTKGTFHSMAGDFLQFIFEYLIKEPGKNEAYQQKHLLQQIVEHALKNLMAFIEPKNMTIFWKTLCEVSKTVNKAKLYKYLLPVYQQVISYKDARYLCELELVVPSLLNISEQCTQAEDIENLHLLCQLICSILMSNCSLLTQLDTTRLLQKMLTLKHRDVFESFVLKICEHIQFELLVLPNVMRYFEQHFDFEAFALLSRLVKAKQPLMDNALNLQQWKSYPLHLKQKATLQKLQNKMENLNLLQKDNEKLQENIMLLMLMPHIVGLSKETLGCKLTQQLELCLKNLSDDSSKNIQILKLLICTCMALNIKLSKNVQKQCLELLQPYVQSNGQALQIWNLLLAQNVSSLKLSIDVHQELLPLLCSHSHQIRMLATHSLYHWHQKSEIYDIFHQVESIEPTLHNYRDQLLLLQRLDCTGEYFKTYQNDESKLASLYFLLGMIYQSFKYVWEPSMKLIEQYAKELKLLEFWPVYKMQLTKTREQIHEHFNEVVQENVLECWDNDLLNDLLPFEQKELPTLQQLLNYRLLLWQHLPGW